MNTMKDMPQYVDRYGITTEQIKRFRFSYSPLNSDLPADKIYINNIIETLKHFEKTKNGFPTQEKRDLVLRNILKNYGREMELIRPIYYLDDGGVWLFDFGESYHIVHELMIGENSSKNRKMDRLDRGYPIDKFSVDVDNLYYEDGFRRTLPEKLNVTEFCFRDLCDYSKLKKHENKKVKILKKNISLYKNSIWAISFDEIKEWDEEFKYYNLFAIADFYEWNEDQTLKKLKKLKHSDKSYRLYG